MKFASHLHRFGLRLFVYIFFGCLFLFLFLFSRAFKNLCAFDSFEQKSRYHSGGVLCNRVFLFSISNACLSS